MALLVKPKSNPFLVQLCVNGLTPPIGVAIIVTEVVLQVKVKLDAESDAAGAVVF